MISSWGGFGGRAGGGGVLAKSHNAHVSAIKGGGVNVKEYFENLPTCQTKKIGESVGVEQGFRAGVEDCVT